MGKAKGKEVIWQKGIDDSKLQSIFQGLESRSEHPLATAIAQHFNPSKSQLPFTNFQSATGKGVQAVHEGITYRIETLKWLKSEGLKGSRSHSFRPEKKCWKMGTL